MKIAFYKGTRPGLQALFSIGVRFWCRGPYSHCEVILTQRADGMALCGTSSFLDGGVRTKLITLDPNHWDILDVPCVKYSVVTQWFEANKGKPYDIMGLVRFLIGPLPADRGKYFCSEAIATAIGVNEGWRFDPNTLYQLCKRLADI